MKFEFRVPSSADWARRIRTQIEWNVATHIRSACGPTSVATLSRISAAALLVNVMARICPGCAPPSASRYAIRRVSTLVLPEPAPATINNGPPRCVTAAACCGLSPSRRGEWGVVGRAEACAVSVIVGPIYPLGPTPRAQR